VTVTATHNRRGLLRPVRGPVRGGERTLASDLARGAMLLLIGVANAAGVALGGPGVARDPQGIDRALNLLMNTLVHSRTYPVFAIMFGYGLVQLARRQATAGATLREVRSLLFRRNVWLVVFGFFHALLLYFGDFLGAYGLIGMVATIALLGRGTRVQGIVLWLWALSALEVLVLPVVAAYLVMHGPNEPASLPMSDVGSLVARDYFTSIHARLAEWPIHTATVLPAIVIVWLGMWAAERRLLEAPSAHLPLLGRIAVTALGLAFLGGLPLGLVSAGILHVNAGATSMIVLLHQVSGMFGGPGYVAVAALASHYLSSGQVSNSLRRMAGLVAALGQRSLSGYLFQSIAWMVFLSPYFLALGRRFNDPMLTAIVVAVLTWVASFAGAGMMQRYNYPGPAETLLRRLTYGVALRG
jgi:uncharacterized protein